MKEIENEVNEEETVESTEEGETEEEAAENTEEVETEEASDNTEEAETEETSENTEEVETEEASENIEEENTAPEKFNMAGYIVTLAVTAVATVVLCLLSVQGLTGLIRRLAMPVTAGIFLCVLVYGVFKITGSKAKKGAVWSIVSQVLIFVIVVGMGYFLLDPIRDLVQGASTEEGLYRIDFLTDEETGSISLDQNGNIICGKYRLNITIYATESSPEKNYTFYVDKSLYDKFKNGEYNAIIFNISYYKNSNILISFDDMTDELISSLLNGQGIE